VNVRPIVPFQSASIWIRLSLLYAALSVSNGPLGIFGELFSLQGKLKPLKLWTTGVRVPLLSGPDTATGACGYNSSDPGKAGLCSSFFSRPRRKYLQVAFTTELSQPRHGVRLSCNR
jgi:hypothetical protein